MKKSLIGVLSFLLMIVLIPLGGCSSKNGEDNNKSIKNTIVDMTGREVELESTIKKAVAIGPGALRLYCYVSSTDKIAGVEQTEKDSAIGRPYILAKSSLKELDTIGPGGPNNSPDAEKILSVKPDVIFTTYGLEPSAADELQSKTGIPVVTLSYGSSAVFDEDLYKSIEIIGQTMGDEERASDVVNFIKECKNDLNERTKNVKEENRPNVYAGALNMKGSHGIESTQGKYPLLDSLNAKNVVDETGRNGSLMIDKEKLIEWNPDKIFIDYGGLDLVKEDYEKNPEFYKTLSAFNNNEVYFTQPYNYYTTNIDTALTDAYYMGSVIYQEEFKDINIEDKADEIYNFLLGSSLYNKMSDDFGGFKRADNEFQS